MPRYRNTGERRVWPTLTDQATGRTLELAAGQEGELAGEVDDPYLERVDDPGTQAHASDSPASEVPPAAPTPEQARGDELRAQIAADEAELAGEEPAA